MTGTKRPVLRAFAILAGFSIVAATLVALGITRTQVGRDALKGSLEAWFTESFDGRLAIGTVGGNLPFHIDLQDVQLYDASDSLMIRAESVILRPNWLDLPKRAFNIRELDVRQVALYARYQADSTWNLSSIRSRESSTSPRRRWEIESTRISLSDGKIISSSQVNPTGTSAQSSRLNLFNLTFDSINLQAQLNWRADERYLLLQDVSGHLLDKDLAFNSGAAEVVFGSDRWHLNFLRLESGSSHVHLTGLEVDSAQIASFSIHESALTPTFVRSFLPQFPVADTLVLAGTIGFAPQRIRFDDLTIRADSSFVRTNSSVDGTSFEVAVSDGLLTSSFLQSLGATTVPAIDSLRLQASGTLAGRNSEASTTLSVYSSSGDLSGDVSLQRDSLWTYAASVYTDDLDLASFSESLNLTGSVRGNVTVTGQGWRAPEIEITANLYAAVINGRSIDSLQVRTTYADKQLSSSGTAYSENSRLEVEADVSWAGEQPDYQWSGQMLELDLAAVWPESPLKSSLNGKWTVRGSGIDPNEVIGSVEINIDSSRIEWPTGWTEVRPHHWTLALSRPEGHDFQFTVGGDVMALEAAGQVEYAALETIGTAWLIALRESAKRQGSMLRNQPPGILPAIWPSLDQILASRVAEQALNSASLNAVTLDAHWALLRGDLLPALVELEAGYNGSIALRANERTLDADITLSNLSFTTPSWSASGAALRLNGSVDINTPLLENLNLTGHARATQIRRRGVDLKEATTEWHLDAGNGQLRVAAGHADDSGEGAISADIEILDDRNRLTVDLASFNIGGELWQIEQPSVVDVFADGVEFAPLALESIVAGAEQSQRLEISGALSKAPEDTFLVRLDQLILERLSSTLGLERRPLGGNLNARLQWTGLGQPEVTGVIAVDTLSLNERLVGSFRTESRLRPGSDELQVRVMIRPHDQVSETIQYASNDLTIDGQVSLPGAGQDGQLDLIVDAKRIDAGFLEELIPVLEGVTGGIAGEGVIRGPLNSPDLNIPLQWSNGSLTIPEHNTSYQASASFDLLREGVHITDLQLTDPAGGTADIAGWLEFNDYRFLSFDLDGQLNALQIMNVPTFSRDLAFYGDLRVSGDAVLEGPGDAAFLRSDNLTTTPQSELLIPIREVDAEIDPGFIIYADSTLPIAEQISAIRARDHLLERRPEGERDFLTGLDMSLNIHGPPGSSIRLVIDPLLGDVINGIGTARVQLQRREGQMQMYGSFDLTSGDYLFTAGEVFVRRFLISEGVIAWEGDPTNPRLDIHASYQTRASRSGLPDDVGGRVSSSLPLIVGLHITGTLNAVQVGLNLAIDQRREPISDTPLLEGYLNQPDRAAEHATSVLLTNSFLLSAQGGSTDVFAGSAFNSVSSLVANQLNRYLGQVIPNADFTLGVQSDESAADLDVSAGIALRLLDERLVIRGLGVYRSLNEPDNTAQAQGLEGEFVVELRLRPNVAVEVFYRRESDALSETLMTSETGLGVNYRAEFVSWKRLWKSVFRREETVTTTENRKRAQPE